MQEINLYDLIKYYAKKWPIIVLFTLLGLAAGIVFNLVQTPLYKSNTKLLLVSAQNTRAIDDLTLINNYINLINSRRVLEPVIKKHNGLTYDVLSQGVQATNQKDTQVIDVTVSTASAEDSKSITNEITESFRSAVLSLYQNDNVVVVDPAVTASLPYNVHKSLQLVLSTLGGLILSLVIVFFSYDYYQAYRQKRTIKILPKNNPQASSKAIASVIWKNIMKNATNQEKSTKRSLK